MFDIGFSELLLVFVIGLIVLGPQRLPVAVRTVMGWIRAMRALAHSVQHELSQELKLQELQQSLRKVEQVGKEQLSPALKASIDEVKHAADALQRSYQGENEQTDDEAYAQYPATEQPTEPAVESSVIQNTAQTITDMTADDCPPDNASSTTESDVGSVVPEKNASPLKAKK